MKSPKRAVSDDIVRSSRFEATGLLQMDTLALKTRFGDLQIKVDDIRTVRWLERGETRNLELDANAAIQDWIDTGIDAVPGEKLAIACGGTINMFNSQTMGPTGSNNWGSNGPFLMGAVVGKLGANGEMYLIAAGKTWNTESKERLYVKIHWNRSRTGRSNDQSKGHFAVKIATGAWADDMDTGGGGQ